ncbi:tetratricopeptide repeat protein [Muricauda oceani]|uniref:Tetratricopeptide repeat protein n=1 Tax=Flagellimonas oceani TaxID=2698672 RepID=A0A6G7J1D0_9FLAO|nr:tetratricopeptide repeat protein [Allomuricauda oceani]MBW8241426.1 tetratricopeptide repeat protein [Allomuricauda oceani]QII44576.1 tetratricopeptide repeat protein [Allomuricauda oceani]
MRLFINIIKVLLATVFTAYSLFVAYQLFLAPKEKRFKTAGAIQGYGISQSMFDILNWQHPDYAAPYFERSVAFNKRGDYETGFGYLDTAVELKPLHHLGYRGHLKLRFLRDYKAALKDFDQLDAMTPDVVDAPWGEDIDFSRGECYYGLGDYQTALQHFEQSVINQGADWVDVQAFVYQGLCHYELENYGDAIRAFKKGLEQYDTTCEAYFGLANTYLKVGDTVSAKNSLTKAQGTLIYKRDDPYKQQLNEIYQEDLDELTATLSKNQY